MSSELALTLDPSAEFKSKKQILVELCIIPYSGSAKLFVDWPVYKGADLKARISLEDFPLKA